MQRQGIASVAVLVAVGVMLAVTSARAQQITATVRPAPAPAWNKGIMPINAESYWNAVECGKQGGADPPCVFWDTGICKNADFTLAFYTGYKAVAYEVWNAVKQKQPAPTPNYLQAQQTRITIRVTPASAAKNPLSDLILKRGARAVAPVDRLVDAGGGRFTFDYPAFAPTSDVTLNLVGRAKTVSCLIEQPVLTQFR